MLRKAAMAGKHSGTQATPEEKARQKVALDETTPEETATRMRTPERTATQETTVEGLIGAHGDAQMKVARSRAPWMPWSVWTAKRPLVQMVVAQVRAMQNTKKAKGLHSPDGHSEEAKSHDDRGEGP